MIVLLVILPIAGCGAKETPQPGENAAAPPDSTNKKYLAETVTMPHEAFSQEKLFNDSLYYLKYAAADAAEAAVIVRVDLTQEPSQAVEIPLTLADGQQVAKIAVDPAGGLHVLVYEYAGTGSEETFIDAFIQTIADDGTVTASLPIGESLRDEEYPWSNGFEVDADGKAYVAVDSAVYVFNQDGGLDFQANCGDGYIYNLVMGTDQKVYALWVMDGAKNVALVDVQNKAMGSARILDGLDNGYFIGVGAEAGGSLMVATEGGVYLSNLEENETFKLFEWFDLNIVCDYFDNVLWLADGRLLQIDRKSQNPEEKLTVRIIREQTEAEQQQAEEAARQQESLPPEGGIGNVTLGMVGSVYGGLKQAIVDFNQANPGSRIEVIEYGAQVNSQEEYDESVSRLNADIAAGNGPDIMIIPPQFPLELYAGKGVLVDLKPYFTADSSLRREDYVENILTAYESDGQLFGMPVGFYVECLTGKAADLGDRTEWNLDELIAFTDTFAGRSRVFYQPTKAEVMKLCLKANGDYLIDWSAETGGFRRETFLKILEFANRFIDDEQYQNDKMLDQRLMDGEVQLMSGGLSPTSVQIDQAMFGEPVSQIGYPSENGSGFLITGTAVAINSKCEAKETAWQFIRSLLTPEMQELDPSVGGYPVLWSALDKVLEQSQKADGGMVGMDGDDISFQLVLRAVTDEEMEKFRNLLKSAQKLAVWDDQVAKIIMEESGAYFSGGKTAAEVADIIENRINIYISEMK